MEKELAYLKRCYEEQSEQYYQLEKKYLAMKHQRNLAENYSDKLLNFITNNLQSDVKIPSWNDIKYDQVEKK